MRTFANVVAAAAAAIYLASGIWAFAAPESFAENVATFPPYNEHLIHDLGAFQIGLGIVALAGLLTRNALAAALAGVAAGSLVHSVSHIVDHGLGGRSSDPWLLGLLGLVTLAGCVAAMARAGRSTPALGGRGDRNDGQRHEQDRAAGQHVADSSTAPKTLR